MYQRQISKREAGQRLDRYLYKLLPLAGTGFLHKMLRKKNITLNGKKAEGNEKLNAGDQVEIFFAEETLHKFMGHPPTCASPNLSASTSDADIYRKAYNMFSDVKVIYENTHILLADKPTGLLTQKADRKDISLNEWLIGYLLAQGEITEAELDTYRPSVCNRLDRNTSGIVLCAKSVRGAQLLGSLLHKRTLHKYYQLYVKGSVQDTQMIEGYLVKDERCNKVSVQPLLTGKDSTGNLSAEDGFYIRTNYRPLKTEPDKTLLEVELITGKPHQIRAHLASIGHPLLGDYKYGDSNWNDYYKRTCQIKSQLLHAYKVTFPKLEAPFEDISGQTFVTDLPEAFSRVSVENSKIQ